MATAPAYDAIIIGASRAAIYLGPALAQAGWHTAIVERKHLGGTCVNVGCTPTKTMVASARVAHLARRAGEYGVQTGPVSVDLAQVRKRKDELVTMLRAMPEGLIEAARRSAAKTICGSGEGPEHPGKTGEPVESVNEEGRV